MKLRWTDGDLKIMCMNHVECLFVSEGGLVALAKELLLARKVIEAAKNLTLNKWTIGPITLREIDHNLGSALAAYDAEFGDGK